MSMRARLAVLLLLGLGCCDAQLSRGLSQLFAVVAAVVAIAVAGALWGELLLLRAVLRGLRQRQAPPLSQLVLATLALVVHGGIAARVFLDMRRSGGVVDRFEWAVCLSVLLPALAATAALPASQRPRQPWLPLATALLCTGALAIGIVALLSPWQDRSVPVPDRLVELALESDHSCARTAAGTVACWGDNRSAQLGDGPPPNQRTWPSLVRGVRGVEALALGYGYSCAVLAREGRVLCWGKRAEGPLWPGLPAALPQPTPLPVKERVVAVLPQPHGLWLHTADGALLRLRFGAGSATREVLPADTVQVVGNDDFWCARQRGGEVTCQVRGASFALLRDAASAMAATASEVCVVLTGGVVSCRDPRQVQALRAKARRAAPEEASEDTDPLVEGLSGAQTLAADKTHLCALTQDGQVLCWGEGWRGQLGDGSAESHKDARVAPLPGRALQVLTLGENSCALLEGERLFCWGAALGGASGEKRCHDSWLGPVRCNPRPTEVPLRAPGQPAAPRQ